MFITEYNSDWPRRFTQISSYLMKALPQDCTIHHVGSTSIPGMPAKDIIDIDIEYVEDDLETIISRVKNIGYAHLGNLGIVGREAFKALPNTTAASLPEHHLYACHTGAYELRKHLAYRDYLRANPKRAQWLANKKIHANACSESKDEYIENKSCFYEIITKESIDWLTKHRDRGATDGQFCRKRVDN